jgi:cytochrome c553
MRTSIAISLCLILASNLVQAQDADNGAQLYKDYLCYSCHGYNGTSPLRPLANDLSGIMSSEDLFLTFLRLRADVNPASATRAMPNYSAAALSDDKARDIYAYVKTFIDEPPEVADDLLMQQILNAAKAKDPAGK